MIILSNMPVYSLRVLCVGAIIVGLIEMFTCPVVGWSWQVVSGLQLVVAGVIGIFGLVEN